jgi:hypothetical protein
MYRANKIYNDEVTEPANGHAADPGNGDTGKSDGRPCKRDGACQLFSVEEKERDQQRMPGKRDGCIGKWVNRPPRNEHETSLPTLSRFHCDEQ